MKLDLCYHPKNMTREVVEEFLPVIRDIMSKYDVSFSYILGSILNKEAKPQDLDLAIYIDQPAQSIMDYYNGVYFDLCDAIKADNLDVVVLNNVDFAFRYEVIKTGRLIYCPYPDSLVDFTEKTLFHYDDLRIFKMDYRRELYKRVKEGILMARRRLNREKIDTFLDSINRALDEIELTLKDIGDFDSFKETKPVRELCIHYLRIALEGVLDICRHIIAVKGFGIPDMERENLIDVLGMRNVIPPDFARKIRGMQGMRNAIVHVYWNLDYEKIYQMITANVNDFENFVRIILEYQEREERGGREK